MDETNPKDLLGRAKPNLDLVPPALLIWTSKAFENGAKKFGAYNWRKKKVRSSIYTAAAMRHLLAYLDGEDTAQDSGIPHLAHAAACLAILMDAKGTNTLIDDRPTPGPAAQLIADLTVKTDVDIQAKNSV